MSSRKQRIFFIVGPTATGKSALAVKLAKKINGEIISCDSMQVYQGLDIVSSQPSLKLQRQTPHHLLSIVSPEKEFSAANYRRRAVKAIKDIHSRNKVPIFAGGTGLYMSVVLDGIFKDVGRDDIYRKKLEALALKKGSSYLHQRLLKVDKSAAAKIHPNDARRIIRALEVYKLTGRPISELQKTRKPLDKKYEVFIFGLNKPREELYADINRRADEMFEQGLVEEVKNLLGKKLSLTCRQAIGVREVADYLDDKCGLTQTKELLKKNTRNYAKRQLTWFRKDKRVCWVDVSKPGGLAKIMNGADFVSTKSG